MSRHTEEEKEEEEEDIALITFTCDCHNCGTPGYMAKDCRKTKKKMKCKFNGSCNGCGKRGH